MGTGLNISNLLGLPFPLGPGLVLLSCWIMLALAAFQFVFMLFGVAGDEEG